MRRLTRSLPYLAAVTAVYLVPALAALLAEPNPMSDGLTILFGSLLLLNSLATVLAAAPFTRRHGATWWFPVLTAAIFLPIALIPPLNKSAFVYAGLYLVTAGLGVGIGHLLRRRGRGDAADQSAPSTVAS